LINPGGIVHVKSALGQQNLMVTRTNAQTVHVTALVHLAQATVITITLSFTYRFADPFLHVMADTSWSLLPGMKLVTLSLSYLDG
jgi:hypothetical protein